MTSGNPILDKNLECIEKYNYQLKEKLLNLPYLTNKIDLIETKLKEPNLSYNDIPLHSQDGAELEAQRIFNSLDNTALSTHIVFGVGIGHLFKECCERSKGKVFLYEPNLEILRVTLELVDFSKELSQENVFIASEIEQFKKLYNQNYVYKANSNTLILPSYRKIIDFKEIDDTIKRFEIIVGSCKLNVKALMEKGQDAIKAVIKNISYTLDATPLNELKDIYLGKTALIVSAGPSLDLNIKTIKNNRDKIIIFCVGTAFKTLMNNGITPDFVNLIENIDCSGQLMGFDLSQINLISEPYTNNSIYLLNVKQNFLYPTQTYNGNTYWANLTDVDISEYIVKGNVSYSAIASAKMLGFSKLIVVGQDLAYVNNKCYSSNSPYSDVIIVINPETNKPELKVNDKEQFIKSFISTDANITKEQIENITETKLNGLAKGFCSVKGINGEMLPTNIDYAVYIEFFTEFAYNNPSLELINTSMIGAQINGFKNIPLEEALEDLPTIKKIELPKILKYDKNKIIKKLQEDMDKLTNILNEFSKTEEYLFNFEEEFKKEETLTAKAGECFKFLLSLYDKISNENQNFLLYKIISFNEDIEIQSALKTINNLNEDGLKDFYGLLKNYYINVAEKITSVLKEITNQQKIIKNSTDSTIINV